jgi:post-segregation antitoxin (ccd killing protein)
MRCNDGGMTKERKDSRLNVRIDEDIREDFHITARLRGANAAALVSQLIIREVREEKKLHSKEKWEEMRERMAELAQSEPKLEIYDPLIHEPDAVFDEEEPA